MLWSKFKIQNKFNKLLFQKFVQNPYQPRKEFDEEGLAELAESIRQNGVFQPIIVRKSKIKGYELVAGSVVYVRLN